MLFHCFQASQQSAKWQFKRCSVCYKQFCPTYSKSLPFVKEQRFIFTTLKPTLIYSTLWSDDQDPLYHCSPNNLTPRTCIIHNWHRYWAPQFLLELCVSLWHQRSQLSFKCLLSEANNHKDKMSFLGTDCATLAWAWGLWFIPLVLSEREIGLRAGREFCSTHWNYRLAAGLAEVDVGS